MHIYDQLRDVIVRRIERGNLTITHLALISNLSAAHVSEFVRGRKDLSRASFDRLMRAVGMEAQILPASLLRRDSAGRDAALAGREAPGSLSAHRRHSKPGRDKL